MLTSPFWFFLVFFLIRGRYHKAFTAKTVATLVSKVAWFVDLRKKSTRYVTAIEGRKVHMS